MMASSLRDVDRDIVGEISESERQAVDYMVAKWE